MAHSQKYARAWKYMRACAHSLGAAPNFRACVEKYKSAQTHIGIGLAMRNVPFRCDTAQNDPD